MAERQIPLPDLSGRWTAYLTPMKPPDHPTPSGDRRLARVFSRALDRAGREPVQVSRLRTIDIKGDAARQAEIFAAAEAETTRLIEAHRAAPPGLIFTYHCYYKAPDLIGPTLAEVFDVPYVIAEASRAPARRQGPWAMFAAASDAAIDRAQGVLWLSARDLPALEAEARADQRLYHAPPFVAPGEAPKPMPPANPLRLVTVAMMRAGDKLTSYHALAAALPHLKREWRLNVVGEGDARSAVEAAFAPFGDRVSYAGQLDDRNDVRVALDDAHIFAWPGVGEAFGIAYLEAEAAGRPVVAEKRPGVMDVVGPSGRQTPPNDPKAFAAAIEDLARDSAALQTAGEDARRYVLDRHGVEAASRRLREILEEIAPW